MANSDNELIRFTDEQPPSTTAAPVWHILLVDDEPDVHAATLLALKNLEIEGRFLTFSHACSAAQALEILSSRHDFAVALIDVVMETEDAGLRLVHSIRTTLSNQTLRIILRTGQPGYAPVIDTIKDYDINDYKTKTELTQVRLFTSLTMAIRAYAQIQQLEANRRGLEQILAATTELGKPVGLKKFASGVVTQLCALLNVDAECLICAAITAPDQPSTILAAAGRYSDWIGLAVADIPEPRVRQQLEATLHNRQHYFTNSTSLFFSGANDQALAAFVDTNRQLPELEKNLLEVFCSNISIAFENLQLYLTINELAFNDSLVLLPNRNALTAAVDIQQNNRQILALVDIDNFADINSILDNSFGDAVLQAVAHRLREHFAESTMVARLGSDLFGLYGDHDDINPDAINRVFADPFLINGMEPLRVSATSGLALLTGKKKASVNVLKNAGAALKQAKRTARGQALYFEAAQTVSARDRMNLLNHLRTSFSGQQLQLYYQPIVRLSDQQVVGAECLLRWKTPDGQFISPDIFIPIAEQSGLMIPIGEWVIRTALKWRKKMAARKLVADDFRVAINVSQAQFAEPDFVTRLLTLLHEAEVPSTQVEIELTESIAIDNIELLACKLEALQTAGVHLSLDDFGTGYSSLSVLQRLTLNRLKIDRYFVSGEEAQAGAYSMAKTIITMANHLNVATLAEGIETDAQRTAMLDAGCCYGQGYLFSKPLPERDFSRWLTQFKTSTP